MATEPVKNFYRTARNLLTGVAWQLVLAIAALFGLAR